MKKYILIGLIILTLVISACSSGNRDTDNQPNVVGGPEIIDEEIDTQEGGSEPGSASNDNDKVMDFFEGMNMNEMEYKIVYDLVGTGDYAYSGRQELVMKGNDFKSSIETEEGTFETYIVNEEFVSCSKIDGGWTCTKFEFDETQVEDSKEEADIDYSEEIMDQIAEEEYKILPERMIAGVKAFCFELVSDIQKAEYCYSYEGVPLYWYLEEEGITSKMTAVEYSTSVSDADLEYPVEPELFDFKDMFRVS